MACHVKIRLPNGEHIEDSFDELDPLSVIAEVVKSKLGSQKFLLSIPFPRRIFTDQDLHDVTLKDAGLAPKGLLIAQLGIATDMKQDTTPAARPGGVKHVKSAREYEALKATPNKLVVVDFTAEWCGPCKSIAPTFEKLANSVANGVFIHFDVDHMQREPVADAQGVSGIPTFKFFKNGKLLHEFSGADISALESAVRKFA